jgi:hypothetical protein
LAHLWYLNSYLGRLINENTGETAEFVRRKAKCEIYDFRNIEEEEIAIVYFNRRRPKRYSQSYNEIKLLRQRFAPAARIRSRANLEHSFENSPITVVRKLKAAVKTGEIPKNLIDWELSNEEIAFEHGYIVGAAMGQDRFEDLYILEMGDTNGKIAKIMGKTPSFVKKLYTVGSFAEDYGDVESIKAMQYLDEEEISLSGAEKIVRLRNIYLEKMPGAVIAKKLVDEVFEGLRRKINKEKGPRKTPAAAMKELIEKCPNYANKQKEPKLKFEIPVYSVILLDLISYKDPKNLESDEIPDYLWKLSIPAFKDSALFIVTTQKYLKQCISFSYSRFG